MIYLLRFDNNTIIHPVIISDFSAMPSSKRPSGDKRNDKKAIKLDGRYNENTLFSKMLQDCGVTLSDGSRANSMNMEQSLFLKRFNDAIVSHKDYPTVTADILKGIEKYMENDERFLRMMLTTGLIENVEDDDELPAAPQDSIVRLMLKTLPLQTRLAKSLIGRMSDFAEDPIRTLENSTEDPINSLHLILNQLRWLDSMEDANSVALKLVETASQLKGEIACSIITSLPEIVGDEVEDIIMDKLEEFLSDNHNMTIPLLNTVGSLNCSPKAFLSFEKNVFLLLNSRKLDEYPSIVKFLLQTMTESNAENNIARMRPHISFSLTSYSQDSISSNQNVIDAALSLLAETILHAAQYRSIVADAWIKILKESDNFTCADFVTIILFSASYNANLRKNAVALLKTKVMQDIIDDQLVCSAFKDCTIVLNQYFATILDLATQFLSSNSLPIRQFGGYLYTSMFMELKSSLRKDVIKSLVQHVSTFSVSEVDTALDFLLQIVSGKLDLIMPYVDCVGEVMDHMERLTSSQMRVIFEIMTRMSTAGGSCNSSKLEETLGGVIRKYSTHSLTKFKCIGIIGAVGTLNVLGKTEICSEKNFRNIKSTLNFSHEIIGSDNRIGSYYFDELCNVSFDSIHPRLRKKLYAVIMKIISEKFVIERDNLTEEDMSLKSTFGSQNDSKSTISVYQSIHTCDSSHLLLCPMFKALFKVATESQEEEVFNLAQLPVQIHCSVFEAKQFKSQTPTEQKMALDALFITINLFRENVNVLCSQRAEFHHLLSRINSILEVENIIESLLPNCSQKYNPPLMIAEFANFNQHDEKIAGSVTQTQSSHTTQLQSPKDGAGVIKKSKTGKRKNDAGFAFQSLKPQYFRELTSGIVVVLETPMTEDLFEEDVNAANSSDDVTLTAGQALFILRDLKLKIVHKLPTRVAEKRSPFLSTPTYGFEELDKIVEGDFGKSVCNAMPSLCNHLESVSSVYEDNRNEHLDMKNRRLLLSLYENILETMLHILSWRGLRSTLVLLKRVLFNIAKRFSPGLSENSSMRNLVKGSMGYLQQFENTIGESSLQAAVIMMKLLHIVSGFDDMEHDNSELTKKLHSFSINMLKIDWDSCIDQTSPAAKKNDHLLCLLKMNVQTSDDLMKCAAHFVDEGLCKLGTDDIVYPNFQKGNSHVLYCGLLEVMADETSKIPTIKPRDEESTRIEILLKWNDCMKVIGVIVKLLREYHSRQNVLASLKHGKTIIDNFIKNGLPICEKLFHLFQDDIVSTLKHLQSSTRQLQHLTCHSKVTQDTVLAKQVPPLKKSLESLIFQVKAMLAFHNCEGAFWLGNLKNRNLQGEEIISQLSQSHNSQDPNTTCEYQEMSYSESY